MSERPGIVAASLRHCTERLGEGVSEVSKSLSVVNRQQKLGEWAEQVSACRNSGLSVRAWCQENEVCEQTYYRWQRRLYELAQEEREGVFAEITPIQRATGHIAVTVQIGSVELAVHNGADAATVEAVLRAVKSC